MLMKKLDLSRRNLYEIPNYVFDDEDLEILDLAFNNINYIPEKISKLKNLKILFLTGNKFTDIPNLNNLSNLFMLSFKSNMINHITEGNLPKSIKWLMLTDNLIKVIPDSFGELINLKKLSLSGNQIQFLPATMVNCKELELIRLSNNDIDFIPGPLLQLFKLSYVAFGANPCLEDKKGEIKMINFSDIIINKSIGKGASGEVFEGIYNNDKVAIKMFHGKATGDGLAETEISILSLLDKHPNLIHVLGKINEEGVVMELVDGYSVLGKVPNFDTITRDVMDHKLTIDQIKVIANGICSAMFYLTKKQIVHGDLYAHNILYKDNKVKLTDFGASFHVPQTELYKQFELNEVRAFGYLLEDMTSVCDDDTIIIKRIIDLCLLEDINKRPRFIDLINVFNCL
jgi:predicted Ser/Thr protein kinase